MTGTDCPAATGHEGVWGETRPSPEILFFHTNTVHFSAHFTPFYGIDIEDLLFVQVMFYAGLLYHFTQNVDPCFVVEFQFSISPRL
jgi:hypothetical protein